MDPISELNAIILNNTIPNALLFTGSCSHEKIIAAMTFAKTINCLNRTPAYESDPLEHESELDPFPCNRCKSCVKIIAEMHPDIITVAPEPDKSVIKIGQIRELCGATVSMPHEARMRMILIHDADTMNQEAANSLLKILEEPPERTFFVLIAKELNDLLPTIISRCRHIRFSPLSRNELTRKLVEQCNIEPSAAMIAANSSNGDIDKAMMFANVRAAATDNGAVLEGKDLKQNIPNDATDWISRRSWLINQLLLFMQPSRKSGAKVLSALIFAEKLSKELSLIEDSLTVIKLWLRDMALVKYSKVKSCYINSELLVNSDFINTISDISDTLSYNYPIVALETIHAIETKLQTNASVRLLFEQFFLSLIRAFEPKNVSYHQTEPHQLRA